MSIFRFSAEFSFFFSLSAFLKIIFRFFRKSPWQKKKKASLQHHHCRESSKGLPPSGEFTELRYAGARFFGFWSKLESAVSPLGTRNLTPAAVRRLDEGRWGWWLGGGMVEGLEMIVTEPVSVLWPSNSTICTPLPFPLPFCPASIYTDTYTLALSHTHTHTHTEWIQTDRQTHTVEFSHLVLSSHCKNLSVCLSLSHTHREDFSRLSSHQHTRAQQCLLRHQSMLKIAWPESYLTSTPLLSLSPPSSPPLYSHYNKQATVISFF